MSHGSECAVLEGEGGHVQAKPQSQIDQSADPIFGYRRSWHECRRRSSESDNRFANVVGSCLSKGQKGRSMGFITKCAQASSQNRRLRNSDQRKWYAGGGNLVEGYTHGKIGTALD